MNCALIESTGCDCDFQCMAKEELKAHIEINHKNVFNCGKCEFMSNKNSDLDNHMNIKHKIPCYTCKEKFNIFSELINHRREKHPSKKGLQIFP